MTSKSDYRANNDVQFYKFGHSCTFDFPETMIETNYKKIPEKVRAKSPDIPRGPSYPLLVPDISKDMVDEFNRRRSIHRQALERDKSTFRKKAEPFGSTEYLSQKHIVRDLLPEIHPIRDERNISPPKFGYNYSIRSIKEVSEIHTNVEDFMSPGELTRPRSGGFSRGHLRSVLGYDSFGPNHSVRLNRERLAGTRALSPNVDRNFSQAKLLLDPEETQSITTLKKQFGNTQSSRMSLHSKYARSLNSIHTLVNVEDKSLSDPRTKRMLWYDSYMQGLQDQKNNKKDQQIHKNQTKKEKENSQMMHHDIEEFESMLKSMSRYS